MVDNETLLVFEDGAAGIWLQTDKIVNPEIPCALLSPQETQFENAMQISSALSGIRFYVFGEIPQDLQQYGRP